MIKITSIYCFNS